MALLKLSNVQISDSLDSAKMRREIE